MNKIKILSSTFNKRLIGILLSVALFLFIPLIAMQFTNNVKWTLLDFMVAAFLLTFAGLTFEYIMRKIKTTKLRILSCVFLFLILSLIWIELAVGIF